MMNTSITRNWKQICDEYVKIFAAKHEYIIDYELAHDCIWVAGNPGTVANICDMFISMEDIRYDIDNDIPEEKFEKWYWKSLDRAENNLKYLNYASFCKGAPDPISPEKEREIKRLQKNVENAKDLLETAIKEYQIHGRF